MGEATSLRAWAERVLCGRSLADKLWSPTEWVDDRPGDAWTSAAGPGRPDGLEMQATESVERGDVESLADPQVRGRVLHAFANHELLALELMALALLRFVDAPPAFRRGVASTLEEEQRHLRAYLQRMRALGVEFGERPLGGFFWRVMSPMPSPLDFMAHMALTFEQANLDFALEYASRMREVGDEATAQILDEVRADEIGHVKLGLVWFQRWRARGPSLFEAHRRALRAPITPRRARGLGLDRAGRRAAGLPDEYIEQIATFEASRGRPPVVHWFDPTAELSLGVRGAFTPSAAMRSMTEDLELLPAFAAARDDVVLLGRAPSLDHRRTLAEAGLRLPEWIVVPDGPGPVPVEAVPHPRLAAVRPWGWSPRSRARARALIERADEPVPSSATDATLHSKVTWVQLRARLHAELDEAWLDGPEDHGAVARTTAEAESAIERGHAEGHRWVVLKAPFGTSGRNAQRIDRPGPTTAQRGWLARTLERHGAVVVEPWLDRVCDVSLRITVDREGVGRIDQVGRFLTDGRGQYLGAVLGPLSRAVPSVVGRVFNGDGRDPDRLARVCDEVTARVAAAVAEHGYAGPVGIDGLVYRDRKGALRLRPLVEVNVRPNLGHVVHGLERQLARGRAGLWVLVRRTDLREGDSMEDAIERARQVLPQTMTGRPARLRSGVVPTTDPARIVGVGTLLLVANHRAEALGALEVAAPSAARRIAEALGPS